MFYIRNSRINEHKMIFPNKTIVQLCVEYNKVLLLCVYNGLRIYILCL